MPETIFDSLNVYESIVAIIGTDPDDLVRQIKAIRTPVKILSITSYGTRQVAYVVGDIRQPKTIRRTKDIVQGEKL